MSRSKNLIVGVACGVATDLFADERVGSKQFDLAGCGVFFLVIPFDFVVNNEIAILDTVGIVLFPQVHVGQ